MFKWPEGALRTREYGPTSAWRCSIWAPGSGGPARWRSQLWQWIRHAARTEDGNPITLDRCRKILREETEQLVAQGADRERLTSAGELLDGLFSAAEFPEFLTLTAYQKLV